MSIKEETKKEKAVMIIDFIHRTIMHHAMWFAEVEQYLGKEEAFDILQNTLEKTLPIQLNRLAKIMGFSMEDEIPAPLLRYSDPELDDIRKALAVNWLANDGVWFQSVESKTGMTIAKGCNDACWGQFSPFEARSVKKNLGLEDQPGLEGLKKALSARLYAYINEQSFAEETEHSFVFRMDQCRVQNARKRKGLDDYPCKSGGLVEYTTFAETIDPGIKTECICCPPDEHPDEYFCAWRFSLREHSDTFNK